MTEPATAACNCLGSQQPCHNCSCFLPVNENDYAHSLECASTAGDLQEAPRNCQTSKALQTSQAPHPVLIHRANGTRVLPNHPICFCCFLRATTMMHAPWDMHPPLGTLKQSPELLRHCIRCVYPKIWSAHTCSPLWTCPHPRRVPHLTPGPSKHSGCCGTFLCNRTGLPSHPHSCVAVGDNLSILLTTYERK